MASDTQIVALLNEAQIVMCTEAYVLMTSATSSTVASQAPYSVPSDFIKIEAVFIYNTTTGNKRRLKNIDLMSRDPERNTGDPLYYYVWGLNVSSANQYAVYLQPIPSSSGTSDLEIWFRQRPLTMVSGGQAPEIPEHLQYALPAYVAWKLFMRDQSAMGIALARAYKDEWDGWLARAKAFINPLTLDSPQQIYDAMGYLSAGV